MIVPVGWAEVQPVLAVNRTVVPREGAPARNKKSRLALGGCFRDFFPVLGGPVLASTGGP